MKGPSVFTIAASAPFAETLAEGLRSRAGSDPLALSSATIYLPTRRAARGFGDAFARVMGGAALLPQFRALGDADEDELLFDAAADGVDLAPAIAPLRRQLLLARLIREWDVKGRDGTLSFAQAAALADSLARVMDEIETQGADLENLKDLAPAALAEHWEGVARFLGVLREQWPALLAAEQALNPAARRAAAMKALGDRLKAAPPEGLVIAAGSTGSIPATAQFLGVIARLPNGAVVLPGLDCAMDAESWAHLDPGHPQYGLQRLLQTMDADRADVKDWFETPTNPAREALLRETLRPAPTTDAWRALVQGGSADIENGLKDIALATCADPAQEGLAIALALRHALETPDRTAALVTPDRNLARRVAAELARWNIAIDDSAGRPLAHASAGAFLCLVAEAAEARFAPVPLLALLKHPFARRGQDGAQFRARARELDRWCLRGPRPDAGLNGIAMAIAKAGDVRRPPPAEALAALAAWWDEIAAILAPLEKIFARDDAPLDELLETHVAAAEALACDEQESCILWANGDGEAAFQLVAALRLAMEGLPPIEPGSWPTLFRSTAMKVPVRAAFGRHPRLAILGPLEARLQQFDLTVLGGLNEGKWPGGAGTDPWFSRPMRATLGLEQPERSIGLAAHDFAMLAAGPQVLLTRALKAEGAPTIPSRWLQRLEQLTRGLKLEQALTPACDYARLAARMMEVPPGPRLPRPAPTPPVAVRPRRLSVTEIETWLRDPYAIYARHVLKLRPLHALDEAIGPLERGTTLHKALELFIERYPDTLPDDAAQRLAAIADDVFAQAGIPKAALAIWRPRFFGAAQGFIAIERERRGAIAQSYLERYGTRTFVGPGGDFILSGQADRIDVLKDGSAAILDYKTGNIPSGPQVRELLSPQLPLEGAILSEGGFPEIGKRIAEELIYLSLADGRKAARPVPVKDAAALAVAAAEKLTQRIALFDDPATPYYPRVLPYRTDSVGDYDHLARVREWSASGGEDPMTREPSMIASDPEISAWVAANAGAGKTYTLANRVARLLMADAKPERILCLTFTKAAAAEMQGRLFRQLGEWAMLPDEELRAEIAKTGGEAHGDLRRARRLFASALETPGGLKVLTLHAFCQIVLSRFPIEAGIPPAFDVLDDQSAREMIAQSRQRILERAGSGDARLAAAVAHLVTETSEFRLTQILDAALGGDRRKLDRLLDEAEDIAVMARRAHGLGAGDSAHGIVSDFCASLHADGAVLAQIPGWLAQGSDKDQEAGRDWQTYNESRFSPGGFEILRAILLTKEGEPRKRLATKKLTDARPDLLAYLMELQARFCAAADRQRAGRAAELAEAALVLIDAMRRDYRRAKRLRGVLDYDDLIVETRNLLEKRGAAAWVLYKLDGGIDHVLIDEAQDTSPEQWDIVRKLTEEFFAGSGVERKQLRTIFAVGDEKQSIFSFQGADPSQFERNREYFDAALAGAGQTLRIQPLITSRRSVPEILSFVDAVFESEAARAGLTSSGGPIQHLAHRDKDKGGIEFWPTLKPDDGEDADPWAPVNAVQQDSPVARLAIQVADRIGGWLRGGARLPGHDRPIAPRDIMILLPRREPFGSEVIRQLKLRKIPVAGADRVRLTEQIAAMDLIALGRFAVQREDDLTLAALLRSPLCGLSEEGLYALAQGREGDLWRELAARRGETPAFTAAHDFLAAMLARADYAPPFEFYSHALTAMAAKEKLLARLGPESADAIDEFLSLTLAYEQSHSPSLEGFLDWVERGGTEIKRDMERGRDEVRVMTVHGAKGLEADIVILPDTTSLPGGLNRSEGLFYTPDGGVLFPLPKNDSPQVVRDAKAAADAELMKEHRRLFYVALTRARDRLCICGFEGKTGVKAGSWYELAQAAAKQLDTNLTRGDDEIRIIGTVAEERGDSAETAAAEAALPGWLGAVAPDAAAMPDFIRPSDIGGAPSTFSPRGDGAKRFLRGNVVHALLARLPEVAPERRHDVALAFACRKGIAPGDAQALVRETLAVLDAPLFAAVFGPGSRAEVELRADRADLGLQAPILGRIDRLAVTDDTVLILDFKTNRPPPLYEADVSPAYLAQMALYRAGAARVFPGRRIVCGLVFTDGPRLLQLSDVVLDAQLAGIVRSRGAKSAAP